jgi:hypothetical protein
MIDRRWVIALAAALAAAPTLAAQATATNPFAIERAERPQDSRHSRYAQHPRHDWRLARRGVRLERHGMRMEREGRRWERRGEAFERHAVRHHRLRAARRHHARLDGRI